MTKVSKNERFVKELRRCHRAGLTLNQTIRFFQQDEYNKPKDFKKWLETPIADFDELNNDEPLPGTVGAFKDKRSFFTEKK